MTSPRVTTKVWIDSYRKRLEEKAIPLFIVKKGDEVAGSILIKISNLKGFTRVFVQAIGLDGSNDWTELTKGADDAIEKVILKQVHFDQDIWILEVEDKNGSGLLEDPSLKR